MLNESPNLELTVRKQFGLFIRRDEVEHFHQLFVFRGLGEMRIKSRFLTSLLIEVVSQPESATKNMRFPQGCSRIMRAAS